MDALRRFQTQLRDYWNGLAPVRRYAILGAAAGVLALLGAVAYLGAGSSYVDVYNGTTAEDAAAVRAMLSARGIAARADSGGTTVQVPSDRFAEARVAVAEAGQAGKSDKGFELFDNMSPWAMTPFAQNVNYQRAIQTELSRSLMKLEPVKAASVIINRPDPTPFVRLDQKATTVSVVLALKPGAVVSRAMAAGMVRLVALSVDAKPEHVTIMDSAMRLLSDPHGADREGLPTPQLEYRRELEAYLASKAEDVLAKSLGVGRAVVQVSADVSFQKTKERHETFTPEGRVASTERLTSSKSTQGSARGPTGMVSNLSRGGGVPPSGGGSGGSQEERTETDYMVSKLTKELEQGGGSVTRLTVAVTADLSAAGEGGGTVISLEEAQDLVKQAVGFQPGRDQIKLTSVRLPAAPTPQGPDEELNRVARLQAYVELARNVSLAAAIALALAIGPLLVLRRRKAAAATTLPAESAVADRRRELLERLADLIRNDPDRAAGVFGSLVSGATG